MLNKLKELAVREKEVLLAFVGTRLLVWVLGGLSYHWFVHSNFHGVAGTQPWELLFRWDALRYYDIATTGYEFTPGADSNVSYFPLLPLCLRVLSAITGMDPIIGGFIIANVALLAAAILFRRLVELDFPAPSRVPERAVFFLLLCPMTFFHSAIYAESLFLLLIFAALLLARKGQWAGAGLAGALLTATRANALVILLPLLWEALAESKRDLPKIDNHRGGIWCSRWWLLIVPAGLLAYASYLHFRFDDALAFWHAQSVFHRTAFTPWQAFIKATGYPAPDGHFFIATAMTGLALCIAGFYLRIRKSYQLFAAAMLILCLSTTWYSLPRYLSVVFPFYIVLALTSLRSEALYTFFIAVGSCLLAICLALYVTGYPMI